MFPLQEGLSSSSLYSFILLFIGIVGQLVVLALISRAKNQTDWTKLGIIDLGLTWPLGPFILLDFISHQELLILVFLPLIAFAIMAEIQQWVEGSWGKNPQKNHAD